METAITLIFLSMQSQWMERNIQRENRTRIWIYKTSKRIDDLLKEIKQISKA